MNWGSASILPCQEYRPHPSAHSKGPRGLQLSMTAESGPRIFAQKGTPVMDRLWVVNDTPVSAAQAKLGGVAQPDRVRMIGLSALALRAALEAPGFVSGLDDLAMLGQAIEQRGGHLGIAEDGGPFAECQIGGDDDAGALIEL